MEFPGARPASRGTPETPADASGCSVRANRSVCAEGGCSVRANRSVCMEGGCSVRANRGVCAERRLFPGRICLM